MLALGKMAIPFSYRRLQLASIILCVSRGGPRLQVAQLSQHLEHLCDAMGKQGEGGEKDWQLLVRNCRCGHCASV